ncbi:MAG: SGNH/GDSL hydrolase family protein [Actinomycetota bacterium]
MSRFKSSGYVTFFSFAGVLILVEALSRFISPSLPVDPGKWPRKEIAQKLDQMRTYVNDREDIDVVFAGSSMMAGGVDPVEFNEESGLQSYNAAFAGASTKTSVLWIRDVIEPLLQPEVVVLGVQTRELSDDSSKNNIMNRIFENSPGYKQSTESVASQVEGSLERISYFLRYRRAFRTPSVLFRADGREALQNTEVRQEIGPWGSRADEPGHYRVSEAFKENIYEKTFVNLEMGGEEYRSIVTLAEALEERDVKLVVLSMPVTDDYWDAHEDPEGDRQEYNVLLDGLVDETGVTVIDAEDAFTTTEVFRDPVHLDIEGRIAFSAMLAERWDGITEEKPTRFAVECEVVAPLSCSLRRSDAIAAR